MATEKSALENIRRKSGAYDPTQPDHPNAIELDEQLNEETQPQHCGGSGEPWKERAGQPFSEWELGVIRTYAARSLDALSAPEAGSEVGQRWLALQVGEKRRWTIWVCPECGEKVSAGCDKPMLPGRGHYHDNPAGEFLKRIFHPAEQIEVMPVSELEEVDAKLEEAGQEAQRFERRAVEAERTIAALESDEAVAAAYSSLDGEQLKWLASAPPGRKAIARAALQAAIQTAKEKGQVDAH